MKKLKTFENFKPQNENIYIPDKDGTPDLPGSSYRIYYDQKKYKIGETVQVSEYAPKHPGKKGVVVPPEKITEKTKDCIKVEFEDQSSDYIPITDILRV